MESEALAATSPRGVLWVAATPLGNLGDISRRLQAVVGEAQAVFAEDTRRARVLLQHLGSATRPTSLHAHNERAAGGRLLAALERGQSCLLLSDAGTPAVSDPGAQAVALAHGAGHRVVPVPGPSALTTALSVAGFPIGAAGCLFLGFLPRPGGPRRQALDQAEAHPGPVVLFESPRRLPALLETLATGSPTRELCLCRELTKVHETVVRGEAQALAARLAGTALRGECTLVLGPPPAAPAAAADGAAIAAALRRCRAAGLSSRDAAHAVSAVLEAPRRLVYAAQLAAEASS